MGTQRGVVLLTIPPEAADRFDYVANRYELTQEQVVIAAVAMLSGMLENRDERATRFMESVRAHAHRSLDVALKPQYQGAG